MSAFRDNSARRCGFWNAAKSFAAPVAWRAQHAAGCDLSGHDSLTDRMLWAMLRFNDRVQAALFNPNRLAATSRGGHHAAVSFQCVLSADKIRTMDAGTWALEVAGLVADKSPWRWPGCKSCRWKARSRGISASRLEPDRRVVRRAVAAFSHRCRADLRARYVAFDCFDDYSSTIDMASACIRKRYWRWISNRRR